MIHPAWRRLLPRLRRMLDARGLSHVAIKEESQGIPLSSKQLIARYGTCNVEFDEYVTFGPSAPGWRIYRVEGAPLEQWIGRARLRDFQETPMISLSGEGKWQMCLAYDQGCLPADTFDDEAAFLATLVDYLAGHFSDRIFGTGSK